MSGLTFTLKARPDQRLDLSPLTLRRLAGLNALDIARLVVGTTKDRRTVGDIFAVSGANAEDIRFAEGSERFDRVGEGMDGGSIAVHGAVGQRAGRAMSGGSIKIEGAAGPFAGSGMSGGTVTISGDAGDDLGGPLAGETAGMTGGMIHVLGSVGQRAGDRMRRGTILVKGSAGAHAGCRMVAGTLVVGGTAGRGPGTLMKRGTIVVAGGEPPLSATFLDNGPQDLLVLRLLAKAVAAEPCGALLDGSPMRRFAGDTAVSSFGEIFVPL